jgi:hypothetical protein
MNNFKIKYAVGQMKYLNLLGKAMHGVGDITRMPECVQLKLCNDLITIRPKQHEEKPIDEYK